MAQQHQHQQDDKQEPQKPAWEIAPTLAVPPSRQGAQKQENKYDQKDSTHVHIPFAAFGSAGSGRAPARQGRLFFSTLTLRFQSTDAEEPDTTIITMWAFDTIG